MIQPPLEKNWDDDQRRIIQAKASSRIIVDAGPGTGKTAVACGRLAYLIDSEGVGPTNIWMICFTRAAVAEIQSRVHFYVGDCAYSITISTIDSRAWAINTGHLQDSKLFRGYDVSIDNALHLIKTNSEVRDEISEIKHLIIDEAQDIVGSRADFVESFIAQLDGQCGVTVFADEAQAIYDFATDDGDAYSTEKVEESRQLLDRLRLKTKHGFTLDALRTIHRTSSRGLKRIFSSIRSHLISEGDENDDILQDIRNGISESADRNDLRWSGMDIFEQMDGHLVLFRTRAEALLAAQHRDFPLSTRIPSFQPKLPAWLALCFHDYLLPSLNEDTFRALWKRRVPPAYSQWNDPLRHWKKLTRIAGIHDGSVKMDTLRKKLSVKRPPIQLVQSEFGLPGPIFGTIHASKGREADHTTLMMPEIYRNSDRDNDSDEARVMFVGATRAKKTLWVGKSTSSNHKSLRSGRVYRWNRGWTRVSVEVGRDEDITFESLVGRGVFDNETKAADAQRYLAKTAYTFDVYKLILESSSTSTYTIMVDKEDICVGVLTEHLRNDLRGLIKLERGYYSHAHPSYLTKVRCWGCSTLVLGPDADRSSIHEPWKNSGFILSPNICSFPSFPLKERRE